MARLPELLRELEPALLERRDLVFDRRDLHHLGVEQGVVALVERGKTVARLGDVPVTARVLWWIQLIVLLGMVLLALPTGEVTARPERRRRAKRQSPDF